MHDDRHALDIDLDRRQRIGSISSTVKPIAAVAADTAFASPIPVLPSCGRKLRAISTRR
jgi:hypothetical protein